MISVNQVSVVFGGWYLLDGVSFLINKKDRIGLTGRNGAGKSTTLKMLAGQQAPTEGSITMASDVKIGYLPQTKVYTDGNTVRQEAEKAFADLFALKEEVERLNLELSAREDYESPAYMKLLERIHEKTELLAIRGEGNIEREVEVVLKGLGFRSEDLERNCEEFSGGWRMRIELAKILLARPDIFLLDEPTNHLDIGSCEALEEALSGYDGTLFVVSHDRYLINRLADKVYALTPQGAELYLGNYDAYLEKREARQAIAEKKAAPKQNLYKQRKERDAELRKKRAALRRLETEIEENDGAVSELEKSLENPDIAADYEAVARISQEIAELREKADALLMQWTALSEELEGLG